VFCWTEACNTCFSLRCRLFQEFIAVTKAVRYISEPEYMSETNPSQDPSMIMYSRSEKLNMSISDSIWLQSSEKSSRNSLKIEVHPDWLPPFRLDHTSFKSCHMGPLFPSCLQSHTDIQVLYTVYIISSTSISDLIPHWFPTSFLNAKDLDISNNRINGTLPTNLKNG